MYKNGDDWDMLWDILWDIIGKSIMFECGFQ
jgi:hypothetical protein